MGHIRDLPGSTKDLPPEIKKKPWAAFAVDLEKDFKPFYCIPPEKQKVVSMLKKKLKEACELILATDEDREGESISWHLKEILKPKVPLKRMVFHEITKSAIQDALLNFRNLDENLVNAQEARRILDRLVGYSISPLLWKNVARGLSAGRVQSVAVALVSDRTLERLAFKRTQYWDVQAEHKQDSVLFKSRLCAKGGVPLAGSSDFDSITGERKSKSKSHILMDEKEAGKISKSVKGGTFTVKECEKKDVARKPPAPFITSSLQQEVNNKYRFSTRKTMQLAQKLYEEGFITYMRTDSPFLSDQVITAARKEIGKRFGEQYLAKQPRRFKALSKGAQEAHEAIRPAGAKMRSPEDTGLTQDLLKIYTLIWKRTMASQMAECLQNHVRVRMVSGTLEFVSSGVSTVFPGFRAVYRDEDKKEPPALPLLKKGDQVKCINAEALGHETKPPPYYTEATLIRRLEKEGVGRPSTYASIIETIQTRGYVKKEGNTLFSSFSALAVTRLLKRYFANYVDMGFTSKMEKDLDDIASGKTNHVKYLKSIYFGKKGLQNQVLEQGKKMKDQDFRSLSLKGFSEYVFKVGRYGAYVIKNDGEKDAVSASFPPDVYPGELTKQVVEKLITDKKKGGRNLGFCPKTKQEVMVLNGRFGPYVQMGADKTGDTIKRASLKPFFTEDEVTLNQALRLLELPLNVGLHPETKQEIKKKCWPIWPLCYL